MIKVSHHVIEDTSTTAHGPFSVTTETFTAATTELGTCLVNRPHPVRLHRYTGEFLLISTIAGKRVLAHPSPPERSDDEIASATDISDDGENEM